MSTKTCPLCPDVGPQPIDNFGICRQRKDGRNLYCHGCCRKKVTDGRQRAREIREAQKAATQRSAEEGVSPIEIAVARKAHAMAKVMTPARRVMEAIDDGAQTQGDLARVTKLTPDQVGDALAELMFDDRIVKAVWSENRQASIYVRRSRAQHLPETKVATSWTRIAAAANFR